MTSPVPLAWRMRNALPSPSGRQLRTASSAGVHGYQPSLPACTRRRRNVNPFFRVPVYISGDAAVAAVAGNGAVTLRHVASSARWRRLHAVRWLQVRLVTRRKRQSIHRGE